MPTRYEGTLFRALNPIYAQDPFSGKGAEVYGGRFNRRGTPALYCSLSVMTALREATQVGNLQPTTLVSYEAEIESIFDTGDDAALHAVGMEAAALSDSSWRDQMRTSGEARTQAFARRLIAQGYNGMLVRSFAPGATNGDINLVLWRWGTTAPARLVLIDDEGRLRR